MPPLLPRRDFLIGAAGAAAFTAEAFCAPHSGSRLLVVFLRGAYDAINVIAPTSNDFYHESRRSIALRKPDPSDPLATLELDSDWSIHPALSDTIYPLWKDKQVAFVPFAGTDDLSRSHFSTQDTIELGQPLTNNRNFRSGFMSRLADILGSQSTPISFTNQVPLCFRGGAVQTPNISLANVGRPLDPRQIKLIQSMYQNQGDLSRSVSEGFRVRDTVFRTLDEEMKAAGRGSESSKGFELAARRMGALMRYQFNLAFVDVGGWDTHINQGSATGQLADRIGELGRGLAGFVETLGPDHWHNTTVILLSEFGRTFRENGDRGTDHGHGSIYWVMSGGLSGGIMAGEQIALTPALLNDGRDLPVLTDYRSLLGGLFVRQYGLSAAHIDRIFPTSKPIDLKLI